MALKLLPEELTSVPKGLAGKAGCGMLKIRSHMKMRS